jgi:hypothetical protein
LGHDDQLSTTNFSGDSRFINILVADINGDGRDDLVLVNNDGDNPTSNTVIYAPSPEPSTDAGLPDLLKTINNGIGGVVTMEYSLARVMTVARTGFGAVRPDLTSTCGGGNGEISSASCGRPNAKPRPLLSGILRDNGQGFLGHEVFAYSNGRVLSGRPSARADLGFELVQKWNAARLDEIDYAINYTDTTYRQDPQFQNLPWLVELFDAFSTRLTTMTLNYTGPGSSPFLGVTLVGRNAQTVDSYEGGANVTSCTRAMSWNWFNLTVAETSDFVTVPFSAADNPIITDYAYAADDASNWYVGKPVMTALTTLGVAQIRASPIIYLLGLSINDI